MLEQLLDFLFSLKHVHLGPGTRFGFVYEHTALIFLGAVVLLVAGYMTYIPQAASPAKKKAMGVIRGVLLAVVLLLACRPQLVMEREDRLRSVVAVWVDNSRSMSLEDPYTGAKADPEMQAYLQKVTAQIKTGGGGGATQAGAGRTRVNRYELATATLGDARWLKELSQSQDIMFFTGAGRAQVVGIATRPDQVDDAIARLKAGRPEGDVTDVPTVVRDIVERVQGQRVSAVVLLTDGQTTERGTRMDLSTLLAQQANTGIFAVPFGQEEPPFDLQLSGFRAPENTFARDPASARITVAATGITAATPVRITVYRRQADGSVDTSTPLAVKEVTLDPEKLKVETEVPIKLQKKSAGKEETFQLVARVEPVAGATGAVEERTLENNARDHKVVVHDAQINVLYVEGYPRWEYRYLTSELIREPTVNISTLLVSADEGFTQDSDPRVVDKQSNEETFPGSLNHFPDTAQDLYKYDVLLIGDVEPTYFSPTQQKLIVDWVRIKGGGLAWIAGNSYNPELYRETLLEVLLPVVPDEIDPRARIVPLSENAPYNLLLTPAGRETNLFRFFDDPDLSWKEVDNLPHMYWFKPVQALKPGAIVLATHPSRSQGGNPAPLLIQRQFGAGPVIFSAYSDTWRWRRYTGEPLFQSYWLQLCRLLYSGKAANQSRRLEFLAESTQIEIGGQVKASLTVRDPTLSGQMPAEVSVLLTDLQGRTLQTIALTRVQGGNTGGTNDAALEKFEGAASLGQIGDFRLIVKPGTVPVETPPIDVKVLAPQREFENITADMQSLRTISTRTSGEIVPAYRAADLIKKIPDRSMPVLHTQSEELWNKPFALILVLLLATGEWWLRKSAGLI